MNENDILEHISQIEANFTSDLNISNETLNLLATKIQNHFNPKIQSLEQIIQGIIAELIKLQDDGISIT
jgi:2C-methyl-D-erythritol 2,4-cyclodiphosphate synthase